MLWSRVALGAIVVLGACQLGRERDVAQDQDEPTRPPTTLVVGPPRQLLSSVPASALAFRADPNGFAAEYLSHRVTVREGLVDVTPKRFDEASRQVVSGGPIGIATTGVFAGGVRLDAGTGEHTQHGLAAVTIARGDVVEQITNRADGVEQSWHFAAKPPAGDLTVEVSVAGQELVAADDAGLHFRGSDGPGFRYSHAIWRDANGLELDLPVRFEGRILITVPEDVVEASAFPAVLDPIISPELFIHGAVNVSTGRNNRNQDVVATATNYYAVWQDQRDGTDDDIYGAPLDLIGQSTVTESVLISGAPGVQQHPVVAAVTSGEVVAWETVAGGGDTDLAVAHVTTLGVVHQLGTIAATASDERALAIVGRGDEALLTWIDGARVRGAIFDGNAFGAPFDIAAAGAFKDTAVSVSPAGDYLVTYTETIGPGDDDVRGQLVTAAGSLDGPAFTIAGGPGEQGQPSAAFNGTNHVVVWSSAGDVFAARIDPAGVMLDPVPVTINANPSSQLLPSVACTTLRCIIAWQDDRNAAASVLDVYGAFVSPSLAIIANDFVIAGAMRAQVTPSVAAREPYYLASWVDNRDLDYSYVRAARVTLAGTLLPAGGNVVARSTPRYESPALAQSPTYTDLVVSVSEATDVNIVHARFTGAGERVPGPGDGDLQDITNAPGSQTHPTAAYVGTNTLAVWTDTRGADRDIYASRVSIATGAPLDPAGIPVSTAPGDQLLSRTASAGSSALIVWQDQRAGQSDIYGALIDASGTVTVQDIPICTGAANATMPAVAYDPVNGVFLIVWTQDADVGTDIAGARVSAAGTLLDSNCGVSISSAAGSQFDVKVAFGTDRFMVVWEDRRNDPNLSDVYGTRVTAAGAIQVLDPAGAPLAVVPSSSQTTPRVAFGTWYAGSFLVAWVDDRNAMTTLRDIYGAQVSLTTGIATTEFVISATPDDEHEVVAFAGNRQNPFNVAYLKQSATLSEETLELRRVSLGTVIGQPCTQNFQCESGFCSDNRCCDSACGGGVLTDCQACSVAHGAAENGVCSVVPASLHLICRNYAVLSDTPQCDVREYCDGVSPLCPPDLGQNAGAVCMSMTNGPGTCPAADASGAPHICQ